MLILVQMVKDERTIARSITFGDLHHPLDDILDAVTEESRVRDPDLDRDGSYVEVVWINPRGRSYEIAKSVTLWPDNLSRKKPSSTSAPDWLRDTVDRKQAPT